MTHDPDLCGCPMLPKCVAYAKGRADALAEARDAVQDAPAHAEPGKFIPTLLAAIDALRGES
jgi:hypothetical protein